MGIKARYLIRVDDICPTMPWDRWLQLEDLFIRNKVSPILAVIPDNQDVELHRAPARENFWDHVRSWQGRGWTIGLHGHQHLYVTKSRGIVEGCPYSEFAGLPLEAQRTKLQAAIDIFRRERVDPEVWVAPAHSFDKNTLKVLRQLGISNVSDGLHLFPCRDSDGMLWVPQQLGTFRRVPVGIWTVCIHLEDPLYEKPGYLERQIETYQHAIIGMPEVLAKHANRGCTTANTCFAGSLGWAKRLGRWHNPFVRYET